MDVAILHQKQLVAQNNNYSFSAADFTMVLNPHDAAT